MDIAIASRSTAPSSSFRLGTLSFTIRFVSLTTPSRSHPPVVKGVIASGLYSTLNRCRLGRTGASESGRDTGVPAGVMEPSVVSYLSANQSSPVGRLRFLSLGVRGIGVGSVDVGAVGVGAVGVGAAGVGGGGITAAGVWAIGEGADICVLIG